MATPRLSAKQIEALIAVEAGRVTYGAEFPALARRQGGPAIAVFLLDGYGVYAGQHATYHSLAERGLIIERIDLLPQKIVPARTRTRVTIAGFEEQVVIPEHEVPEDDGWRADVQLTADGRQVLARYA